MQCLDSELSTVKGTPKKVMGYFLYCVQKWAELYVQIKRESRSHFKQITTMIWYGDSLQRIWKHEDNYLYVLLEFHLKPIISLTFRGIAFVIFLLHVLLRWNARGGICRSNQLDFLRLLCGLQNSNPAKGELCVTFVQDQLMQKIFHF